MTTKYIVTVNGTPIVRNSAAKLYSLRDGITYVELGAGRYTDLLHVANELNAADAK